MRKLRHSLVFTTWFLRYYCLQETLDKVQYLMLQERETLLSLNLGQEMYSNFKKKRKVQIHLVYVIPYTQVNLNYLF